MTDSSGRVVVLHGVNMVYKLPPYYPGAIGFGADDAAFLARTGFNVVRVGVIWKALEPVPGVYDDAYLARIAATVRTLGRHGIYSVLDFHQDLLNEKFGGEGWPDWAILDNGLPAQPLAGFPLSYVSSPGLNAAIANFYANVPGPGGVSIPQRLAEAWEHVARRFASDPWVLGYDLLNEPWSGNLNLVQCYSAQGCPGVERGLLAPVEARVMRAIRLVDRAHLLWYEPIVETQAGMSRYTIQNPTGDPRAGMSFHVYCLPIPLQSCSSHEQSSLDAAVANAQADGEALLESEWGASNDLGLIDRQLARDDRAMMSWVWWAYTGFDPTTAGPGANQSIVLDPHTSPTGSNVEWTKLVHLVEPYPHAIAGTPIAWGFDRAAGNFSLRYSTARVRGRGRFKAGTITEVFVPRLLYPHGYRVHVRGGTVTSRRGASILLIAQRRHASMVSVTLTPD
jgi:endoglycosylceramidase